MIYYIQDIYILYKFHFSETGGSLKQLPPRHSYLLSLAQVYAQVSTSDVTAPKNTSTGVH